MRVRRLTAQNFRGIGNGVVDFAGHTLLVGGNNTGKSTICDALDLVLGPERLYRRPVVNEHDFYKGRYLDKDKRPVQIRIEALLLDLSEEAERRFLAHLRRWNDQEGSFADEAEGEPAAGDAPGTRWALPVLFIGRYDADEDDFIGDTFFAHPQGDVGEDEDEEFKLGAGLRRFAREHKRLCGFVFLRTLRTGTRALSLQRGSLLDTVLRLGSTGPSEMWEDTLGTLRTLDPAIGEIAQLRQIRAEVQARVSRFVSLAPGDDVTAFFASDLTREHLREVVRFFITSEQSRHLVPFQRLGTGAINMLVFALLTFIAELKEKQSVIFAMEEPEIALPPHTQRRVVQFVLREMGQTIVTSHSPYVIERFEPQQIVMLERGSDGTLFGTPVDIKDVKPKAFKTERRQFAEAVLTRAVLVVEGGTEAAIFSAASTVMEDALGPDKYTHFDLAGVSVFDARGAGEVPRFGLIFKSLGKIVFGFYDKLAAALTADNAAKLAAYTKSWESPEKGMENLLATQTPVAVLRRFLDEVKDRSDYPSHPQPDPAMSDAEITELARKVLKVRKGHAYAYGALFIMQCESADDLPPTIRTILEEIHAALSPAHDAAPTATEGGAGEAAQPTEVAEQAAPQQGGTS